MGAGVSQELTNDDLDEIMRETRFTRSEILEMYEKFKSDFPSGEITPDGFATMYATLFPGGDTTAFSQHVFRAYDQDGNGVIDFKEFMSTLGVVAKGTLEQKLQWAFRLYDIDGDGTISRPEATEMIMAIYRMQGIQSARENAEDAALQFFLHADRNKDDSISQQEFITAVQHSSAIRKILKGIV